MMPPFFGPWFEHVRLLTISEGVRTVYLLSFHVQPRESKTLVALTQDVRALGPACKNPLSSTRFYLGIWIPIISELRLPRDGLLQSCYTPEQEAMKQVKTRVPDLPWNTSPWMSKINRVMIYIYIYIHMLWSYPVGQNLAIFRCYSGRPSRHYQVGHVHFILFL